MINPKTVALMALIATCYFMPLMAQQLAPPTGFSAHDAPNDNTGKFFLRWDRPEPDLQNAHYVVFESASPDGPFLEIATVSSTDTATLASAKPEYFGPWMSNKNFRVYQGAIDHDPETKKIPERYYKIGIRPVADPAAVVMLEQVVSVVPHSNLFKWSKLNNLLILVLLYLFVWLYIELAKRNPNIFLRKIAGLEAVEEAIGRATEMGKPILYSTGYYDASEVSTIASINILGEVAKKVANYDSRLIVPCKWPVAMTVCQEVVREAFLNVGRPDAYNNDDIFFIAGEQFSYTAAVNGLMTREKPAANFFLGTFAAEALLLAETGNMIGAIQISGTDSVYQIPFFIAACDYCLIGEELYAASAYLSREPRIVGTLKGQDMGKILLVIVIILGALALTIAEYAPTDWEWLHYLKYLMTVY